LILSVQVIEPIEGVGTLDNAVRNVAKQTGYLGFVLSARALAGAFVVLHKPDAG